MSAIENDIDERRRQHPAHRGYAREKTTSPAGEVTVEYLAFDLEPHQQEEERHQPIVDPVQKAERADLGIKGREVYRRERRVRGGNGQQGHGDEKQAT